MALDVTPGAIVKLRWYCTLGNQASVTTHYYLVSANQFAGTWPVGLLATTWTQEISSPCKSVLTQTAHFDGGSAQIVTSKPFGSVVYSNNGAGNGARVGNPLPTQVSGIISRRTDFSGRSQRGRIYVPFVCVIDSDTNGLPTLPYQTLLGTLANDIEPVTGNLLSSGANTILLMPIIVHKSTAIADTPITGHEIPLKFGTQRRRGSYGRPNFTPPLTNPTTSGVIITQGRQVTPGQSDTYRRRG